MFSWLSEHGNIIRAKPNFTDICNGIAIITEKIIINRNFCEGLEFRVEF